MGGKEGVLVHDRGKGGERERTEHILIPGIQSVSKVMKTIDRQIEVHIFIQLC